MGRTRLSCSLATTVTDLGFFYDWLVVDTLPQDRTDWSSKNWQL